MTFDVILMISDAVFIIFDTVLFIFDTVLTIFDASSSQTVDFSPGGWCHSYFPYNIVLISFKYLYLYINRIIKKAPSHALTPILMWLRWALFDCVQLLMLSISMDCLIIFTIFVDV